jgi:hypothetical protein
MEFRKGQRHRRDWRRLWRYCRCGYRWRCPDSTKLVPLPYGPFVRPMTDEEYRAGFLASSPVPKVVHYTPGASPEVTRGAPPPSPRSRATNRRADPAWNGNTGHHVGGSGRLTRLPGARVEADQ